MAQKNDKDYIINGLKGLSKQIKNIKLEQWVVIVASLVALYFVYQDYTDKKSEAQFCKNLLREYQLLRGDYRNYPAHSVSKKAHLVEACAKHWGSLK